MNEREPSNAPAEVDDDKLFMGEYPVLPFKTQERELTPAERIIEGTPDRNQDKEAIARIRQSLMQPGDTELWPRMRLSEDYEFVWVKQGEEQSYRRRRAELEAKGLYESLTVHHQKRGEHEVLLAAGQFNYLGGSAGVAAAAKFNKALELALQDHRIDAVIYEGATGGARQHEGSAALRYAMEGNVAMARKFKEETSKPFIFLIGGQVYGGIPAGLMPEADIVVAAPGFSMGFTGERVTIDFTGHKPSEGYQRVEVQCFQNRIIDVIVPDDRLNDFINRLTDLASQKGKQMVAETDIITLAPRLQRTVDRAKVLGKTGLHAVTDMLHRRQHRRTDVSFIPLYEENEVEPDAYAKYEELVRNADRLDTDSVMQGMLTDVVPIYNYQLVKESGSNYIKFPAIIAAAGRIGGRAVMVLGHQPSYMVREDESLRRIPATPGPKDFEYETRMIAMAKRYEWPIITLTDTYGADPSEEAERHNIGGRISKAIGDLARYPYPLISVIIGVEGSGGGRALAVEGDDKAMLKHASSSVASIEAASSILSGDKDSERHAEKRLRHLFDQMNASAKDQRELYGYRILPEYAHDPGRTIVEIHNFVIRTLLASQHLASQERLRRRLEKVREPQLKHLHLRED